MPALQLASEVLPERSGSSVEDVEVFWVNENDEEFVLYDKFNSFNGPLLIITAFEISHGGHAGAGGRSEGLSRAAAMRGYLHVSIPRQGDYVPSGSP